MCVCVWGGGGGGNLFTTYVSGFLHWHKTIIQLPICIGNDWRLGIKHNDTKLNQINSLALEASGSNFENLIFCVVCWLFIFFRFCPHMGAVGRCWWQVNFGSANGLMLPCNSQSWPRFMPSYGITRPQWVKAWIFCTNLKMLCSGRDTSMPWIILRYLGRVSQVLNVWWMLTAAPSQVYNYCWLSVRCNMNEGIINKKYPIEQWPNKICFFSTNVFSKWGH